MLEYQKTHGTVYVVDDDEAIRDSICWLLEASDYNVELYESGESFIAHYNPVTIAVLLLDIRMNGMSGLEVQNFLREKKADIPIITIHGLRHTHASLLLFAGVSIASVARRLGHASMTTTQKTYLHIINELENKDIDIIMRSLSSLG